MRQIEANKQKQMEELDEKQKAMHKTKKMMHSYEEEMKEQYLKKGYFVNFIIKLEES